MTSSPPSPLPERLKVLQPKVIDGLVRVGNPTADGGYVIPEAVIATTDAVISLGVGDEWMFEEELLRRNNRLCIHAYDHTIGARPFLRLALIGMLRLLILRESVGEILRRIRVWRSYRSFFGRRCLHFRERIFNRRDEPSDVTVGVILSRVAGRKNLVVKMDIEGCEYRILHQLLQHRDRIDLLIVEFHDTDPLREMFLRCVEAISGSHDIVHLHGNNYGGVADDGLPEVLEITFLHKRLVQSTGSRPELPLEGLDSPNLVGRADYRMLFP